MGSTESKTPGLKEKKKEAHFRDFKVITRDRHLKKTPDIPLTCKFNTEKHLVLQQGCMPETGGKTNLCDATGVGKKKKIGARRREY